LVINPSCASSSNGLCTSCPSGYTVLNGVCVNIVSLNPYCAALNGTACATCLNGYYLNNGYCFVANTLCFSYNPNSGACTACYSGYIVYDGACVVLNLTLVNPNCLTFNGIVCEVCETGFYFFEGICIAANQYCYTFDSNSGFCLTCPAGFTLYGNFCYEVITCASQDLGGSCLSCISGYIVW
jgi:hypothetical protein